MGLNEIPTSILISIGILLNATVLTFIVARELVTNKEDSVAYKVMVAGVFAVVIMLLLLVAYAGIVQLFTQ